MNTPNQNPARQRGMVRSLVGWTVLSFGLTFTLFGALYAQDMRMLSRAPEILWYAMCGQPLPDGSTGPLLFGIGFAGAMAGALLLLARPKRQKPS